jgi:hypothetical protein
MSFTLLGILNSQAAGGGGGSAYDHITTITPNGATYALFSGLATLASDGYKHLQIRYVVRNGNYVADRDLFLRYPNQEVSNNDYNYATWGTTSGTSFYQTNARAQPRIIGKAGLPGNGASYPTGWYGSGIIDIADFYGAKTKTAKWFSGIGNDSNAYMTYGEIESTAALTHIGLYPEAGNYDSYSRISLYATKG